MEEEKKKRETHTVDIGPLLKEVLDKQKDAVMGATYDCCQPSYYEAGEMIAKKVKQSKLV